MSGGLGSSTGSASESSFLFMCTLLKYLSLGDMGHLRAFGIKLADSNVLSSSSPPPASHPPTRFFFCQIKVKTF